jgi:hypothetical protein
MSLLQTLVRPFPHTEAMRTEIAEGTLINLTKHCHNKRMIFIFAGYESWDGPEEAGRNLHIQHLRPRRLRLRLRRRSHRANLVCVG